MIFPTGHCDNGSMLMTFKRGAFVSEKRLQPLIIKLDLSASVSVCCDVIDAVPCILIQLCWLGWQTIELGSMPDFEPNEYLFEKYADKGEERWQIFAWAVREAMSKASGLPVSDLPNRTKLPYNNYLNGLTDEDPVPNMLTYLSSVGGDIELSPLK